MRPRISYVSSRSVGLARSSYESSSRPQPEREEAERHDSQNQLHCLESRSSCQAVEKQLDLETSWTKEREKREERTVEAELFDISDRKAS